MLQNIVDKERVKPVV